MNGYRCPRCENRDVHGANRTYGSSEQKRTIVELFCPACAREVYGKILAKYEALGQAAGQLGFPTTGVFSVKAGKRVKCAHGSLTYVRATGKVVVNLH